VGYVQGMNFIAAVLLYHAGEVAAFWLLCALMDTYKLKMVLSAGLPGLPAHEERLEKLGREELPELF
jgi:predicted aldo/keto reductase-like oxidoreductase